MTNSRKGETGQSSSSETDTEVLCSGNCGRLAATSATDGSAWIPGVVVVEFSEELSPEIFSEAVLAGGERTEVTRVDIEGIRKIFDQYALSKNPEWTFSYDPSAPPAEPDRQRFITFYFSPQANVEQIAEKFASVRGIVQAAPEPILAPPAFVLNEPLLNEPLATSGGSPLGKAVEDRINGIQNQWYLFRCQADGVLDNGVNGKSGKGVVIADIDWGFFVQHQELDGRIEFPYNFKNNSSDVSQGRIDHGTGVLGILGAGKNGKGMLGFAYGAALWAIQADDGSKLDNAAWAQAIDEVVKKSSQGRPKVILIEAQTEKGGNVEMSLTIRPTIVNAIAKGAIVCVPAGDAGIDAGEDHSNPPKPIPKTGSILIGATRYSEDASDIKRGASNYGQRIVISAPGDPGNDVTCCICGNNTYRNGFGGTSGAAAKVAGTIALMLETNSGLTHEHILDILHNTGTQIQIPDNKPIGTFLNTAAAVKAADAMVKRAETHFYQSLKHIIKVFSKRLHKSRVFFTICAKTTEIFHYMRDNLFTL